MTIDVNAIYRGARTCVCGALIEELDGGGYTYWLHVKRMRISYDHAAVPVESPGWSGKDPNVERDAAIQRAVLDGATLDELAARHSLTRERIRQIAYKDPVARERVRLGLEQS